MISAPPWHRHQPWALNSGGVDLVFQVRLNQEEVGVAEPSRLPASGEVRGGWVRWRLCCWSPSITPHQGCLLTSCAVAEGDSRINCCCGPSEWVIDQLLGLNEAPCWKWRRAADPLLTAPT